MNLFSRPPQLPVSSLVPESSRVPKFPAGTGFPGLNSRRAIVVVVLFWSWMTTAGADGLDRQLDEFVGEHCQICHDSPDSEGGFDFGTLSRELGDAAAFATWERAYDRVRSGEMPPADMEAPPSRDRDQFLRVLQSMLTEAHLETKGHALRRLNRSEYENTLNDLFGTRISISEFLPEDGRSHEFDTVGEALSISLEQMQGYLNAAERVLDEAIADRVVPTPGVSIKASYADSREGEKFIGDKWLLLEDGAVVFFRRLGYPTGMLRDANVRVAGKYKIRVRGYAYQSDEPITFSVGSTTFRRGAPRPTYGYFAFAPGPPTTIELEAWIDDRYMIQIEPYGISDDYKIKNHGIENYRGPGLAILSVELEGPIVEEFPTRGHRLVMDGFDRREIEPARASDKQKPRYRPKFEIVDHNVGASLKASLLRVANAAFRRSVGEADIAPYVELFDRQRTDGATIEEALRTAVTAILCSTDFLFFRERSGRLDDAAVASRMSYFLTRTTPDAELLASVRDGSLCRDESVLREQTQRLLSDDRFERFVVDFTDAWLDLRQMNFTNPDQKLFPEFDPFLRFSMPAETRAFFRRLIDQNLPVSDLVKPDFAMLNHRLAEHYEIDGVDHPDVRPVRVPANGLRGGLLSQASVLKVTANGTNTSPVVRGVWVTERILGKVPPPPPAGIAGIEPDIRGATTLRQLLDKHRDSESCRRCHQLIDPPGFALECFNPVGGFRERFRSLGEGDKVTLVVHGDKVRYRLGPPVDASGQFPDGKKFSGYREFRDELASRPDILAKTLVTKLLTFATGREMGFSDRDDIHRIVSESAAGGYRLGDLIHLIVQSPTFQHR